MKPYLLLILFASVVVVNSQNLYPRKYPMHDLCKAIGDEKYPAGMVLLNPHVISIEMPVYPQRALENRIEGRVEIQVFVNENGEVVTATPILGFEDLWAASVRAAVTARFDPKMLAREPSKVGGILAFKFWGGKFELEQMSDTKNITAPPVRRGIPRP